jgi:hypothetical protein
MYKQCPHKWYLQYVKKLRDDKPNMHFVFGTAMHEAIQHYLQTMYDKSASKADNIDIRKYFKERMSDEYSKYKKKNKDRHFSTPEQMNEFFQDGVGILEWFKKHKRGRKAFFSPRQSELVGIEVPLILQPIKERPNIKYMGYVDLVVKDKNSGEYTIYDIKTSTKGWSKWEKGDITKSQQLLLYKNYYSELFKVPKDKINIEFFIVKRKVLDFDDEKLQSPHQAYRVQSFKPTDNPKRLKDANEQFTSFIRECYTAEGQPIDKEFPKCPTKLCDWCEFGKNRELCGEGLSPDEKFFTLG